MPVVAPTPIDGTTAPISGNLSRADVSGSKGTPRKNQSLTIRCTYYIARYSYTCPPDPTVIYVDSYTGYVHTTTDIHGNFSFMTLPGTYRMEVIVGNWTQGTSSGPCVAPGVDTIDSSESATGYGGGHTIFSSSTFTNYQQGFVSSNGALLAIYEGLYNNTTGKYAPISGSVTLDFAEGANAGLIRTIQVVVHNPTGYYYVNNASITMTDSLAGSNTFLGGNLTWGGATWTDWVFWNGMTINAGIPPDCNYSTNPNLTFAGTTLASLGSYDIQTTGNTLPVYGGRYYTNFNWLILLQNCVPTITPSFMADSDNGVLAVAWNNTVAELRMSRHLSPSTQIGSGSVGWETTQFFAAEQASLTGLSFLTDQSLYMDWSAPTGGYTHYKTSTSSGASGAWNSTSAALTPYLSGATSVGRNQRLSWRYRVSATNYAVFERTLSADARWYTTGNVAGAVSPHSRACGVYIDDGWICLYNSSGNINKGTSSDGIVWTTVSLAGVLTDTVVSLVRTRTGKTLIGLTWDSTSKLCKVIRSYDSGLTWEQDTSTLSVVPVLSVPPVLVPAQEGTYAVWVLADVPTFVFSHDAGLTWV
jgi:hypothetical protein